LGAFACSRRAKTRRLCREVREAVGRLQLGVAAFIPPIQAVMTFRAISSRGALSFGLGDVGRYLLAAGAHS